MKKILPVLLALLLLAAAVAEWFVLPDPLNAGLGFEWATPKPMPKLLALGVGAGIGILGAYQAMSGEEVKKGGYIMMLLSAALFVVLYLVNR